MQNDSHGGRVGQRLSNQKPWLGPGSDEQLCCWITVFVDEREGGVWARARWWRVVNATTGHVKGLDSFLFCDLTGGVSKVLLHGPGHVNAQADYVARFSGQYPSQ